MSRRAAVAILLAGVAMQGAIAALGMPPAGRGLAGDEQMYVRLAGDLAAGRAVELDPLWPPGYPLLLGAWLSLAGSLPGFFALQVLAHLVAAALLARLTWRLTGDRRVAALAATLLAIDPQVAAFAQTYWPETLHLALVVALLVAATEGIESDRGAVAFGAGLGTALLLKSLLTPFVPVLLLSALYRCLPLARWRRAAASVSVMALLLAPAVWSNHRRHGFWGVADSTRFNLGLGLADRSPRSLRDDGAYAFLLEYQAGGSNFAERQHALGQRIRGEIERRGAAAILAAQLGRQFFRLFDRESYFAAMLPGTGALAAIGQGFRDPPAALAASLGLVGSLLYGVVLTVAPLGLLLLLARRDRRTWLPIAFVGYQVALFVFLHVKARYRLPLMPVLDLAAALAIVQLADRFRGRLAERWSPGRWVAGAIGGALLLLCGFGAGLLG